MQDLGALRARLLLEANNFKQGMQQARDEMSKTGFSSRQASRDMALIQKASLAIGTAVVAGVGASVKVAADFEQSMARVKAVSGATEEEFSALKATAQELGATTQFSASQAAEGMNYLAMAGFETSEIIGAMPSVLNLAAAAQIDLGRSSDIVSNIMTGFGITAEDTGHAVDVLVKTMTTANTDLPMLGEAMKYVAPVAASLGLGIEETAAAIAKMSDAGIQGSQAGTTLRASLLSLANPTGQTKDAIDELGIKVKGTNNEMKPLPELIGHIADKMEGMTDAQKTATAAQLVGTEAASGFVTLLSIGEEGLKDYTKELKEAGGTAERIAKTQMDTLLGSFKEFQSAVEGLGIKIGDELLPLFTDIVREGAEIVRVVSEMDTNTVMAGIAFTGTAAAIGLAVTSISKLVIATRALMLSMGPAGWLITGISVLGGLMAAGAATTEDLESAMERLNTEFETATGLEKSISEFDDLKTKTQLSTDEFARFIDINAELSKTTDVNTIERLKDEQDKLREKSGLSNDELKRMADLNAELTEKVPSATEKISEQGQAIIDNTSALKDYSKEKLSSLYAELDLKRLETEVKYKDTLQEEKALIQEQKRLHQELLSLQDIQTEKQDFLAEQKKVLNDMDLNRNKYSDYEIKNQQDIVTNAEEDVRLSQQRVAEQAKKISGQQTELENVRKEIKGYETIRDQMVAIELKQVGINAKKGQEIQQIDKAISKLEVEKKKLQEKVPVNQRNTEEYKNAVSAIDNQISSLNTVKSRVQEITGQAKTMNSVLSENIQKQVNITTTNRTRQIIERGYESATGPREMRHSGGPLPKLHIGGVPDWLSNIPNHNEVDVRLLRNEMVLTEAQQAHLFRMLDEGSGSSNTSNGIDERVIQLLQQITSGIERGFNATVIMNDRVVGKMVEPYITENQKRNESVKNIFASRR